MSVMAATSPPSGPYTVADLELMPDDGQRYELVDGELFASPAPGTRHQKIVLKLGALLDSVCPGDLHVLAAPFAVRPSERTEVQPDVLVARDEDLTEKNLPVAPLLAVEVLSPSTASNDFISKKAAYERMGAASYWIIDPEQPRLMVFELDEHGQYRMVADVKDSEVFEAERPFPVRIVPVRLLGTLRHSDI
jgi:Uma2 family endonuclease